MYVNKYFQTAHQIFPILGRKHFDANIREFWDGRPTEGKGYEVWTAVFYMTIALGHQYCLIDLDEKVRQLALSSPDDGEKCFQLMKLSCRDVLFEGGDISVVNCLLLAVRLKSLIHVCDVNAKYCLDSFCGSTTNTDCTKPTTCWEWQ